MRVKGGEKDRRSLCIITVPLKVVSIPYGHDNNLQLHSYPPGAVTVFPPVRPTLSPFPQGGAPLGQQPSLLMMAPEGRYAPPQRYINTNWGCPRPPAISSLQSGDRCYCSLRSLSTGGRNKNISPRRWSRKLFCG